MNPIVQFYLLDLGILMGILAGVAVIYIALLGGLGWLLSRRWGKELVRALSIPVVLCIVFVVIAIPIFSGIAGLYRYDPPGGILIGMGMPRQDWQRYASVVRVAFFALYGLLIILGGAIGYLRARPIGQGKTGGITAALIVLLYLAMTLPVVDFFNACTVGKPFLLPLNC